mmetsp:Transcript_40567/g.53400  ORF Transcript_40567/g.53400 Transcript_40567/m.53400 type:complete len:505 (+) Transcript_40567:275-1789(+)|eukprot:CAMPEP_0117761422 /NCGR_PEP_ID=MMETSP0947-20121206/17276_1 /TAXON_ID=44440 /ORGANISM="Chattonella subsalsa, Strain CCMP2191" /LENGTH=504 /DNA_ID=CAMNT_0005582421 /DNA_START=214 /DNA_END=1728 /DNA_ORIENTATION=+
MEESNQAQEMDCKEENTSSAPYADADPPEDVKEKATEFKNTGNKFLQECHFAQAIEQYTLAIELWENAIFFSNRAQAHIKSEAYGLAISDADRAIELEPDYIKGYYRRGSAYFALTKYKKALKDFRAVVNLKPKDRDAREKFKACQKAAKEAAFAAAIESEETTPLSQSLSPESIVVEDSYDGPRLEESGVVTVEFVEEMLERFKNQKLIHKKYVIQMLLQILEHLRTLPSLVHIQVTEEEKPLTVCGDTHGQYFDVLNIFELNGKPSEDRPYLFNGDFVDRGSFSFEVILTLIGYKLLYPDSVHLTRGNHETVNMNKVYGFEGEVKAKYDMQLMQLFTEVFNMMPLSYVINNKVMVVHGGLPAEDGVKLDDISAINRNRQPPESGLMSDLLWADPQPLPGRMPSKRGVGKSFGPDVTARFLEDNGLELLVRSHEVKDDGYEVAHNGKCVTIFSAPNYCDQMGNKGAFILFGPDMVPKYTQFEAVPHPNIRPMAYASGMGMFGL